MSSIVAMVIVAFSLVACFRKQVDSPVLKVLTFRDRQSSALRAALSEFESEHRIQIQFDDIPAGSVATKMMTDLLAGGTYDVYAIDEPFVPQFQDALLPVAQWPQKPTPADLSAFEPRALEAARVKNELLGLPINGNVYQYIFRKDLFENEQERIQFRARFHRDLRPATQLSEMLELAQFFYRPPKLYGFAPFTKMSEGTTVEFLWLLAAFGHPLGHSPERLEIETVASALRVYAELLKTAPRAARSWHHNERMSSFAKGKVAQMMTWNSFFFDLEDENKSLVVGRTGYAQSPGRKQDKTVSQLITRSDFEKSSGTLPTSLAGTWVAGINKNSKQADVANAFILWWTSRQMNQSLVQKGLSSARSDVLLDTSFNEKFPWFASTHFNFQRAFLRPRGKQYRALSDEVSQAFTRWIAGQTNESEAAKKLHATLIQLEDLARDQTALKESH